MPRNSQQAAHNLTNANEAALDDAIESRSEGCTKAAPASKEKAAAAKDSTARDPNDPGAKAARSTKKATSKKKAEPKATRRPAKYGRAEALIDALKKGGTRAEIAQECDRLYLEHGGGQSSLKGARAQLDLTLGTLKAAGVVEEDAGKRLTLKR